MNTIDSILYPLKWAVAAIMVGFHKVFSFVGIPADSGWNWVLSIAGLVVVIRILLIPLFVKQIHASRRMQLIQPEVQKIQKKYKGKKDSVSRQKLSEETMSLYRETGTNPFGSCMPILVQAPFFFALFRVLNTLDEIATGKSGAIGFLTQDLAKLAEGSTFLGAKLSQTFLGTEGWGAAKFVSLLLIILMSVTTFTTQHQLMRKNMPEAALDNPMAKQQKYLMYAMPVIFMISGVNFPIGVLIYWAVTNLWTMGQQFYVIRRMPAPGSAAELALKARAEKQGKTYESLTLDDATAEAKKKGPGFLERMQAKAQEAQATKDALDSGLTREEAIEAGKKARESALESSSGVDSGARTKREMRPTSPQSRQRSQPTRNRPRRKR